jgi:Glyoxalase/Bleomycin resistance protein/Dioxygenase superfamily
MALVLWTDDVDRAFAALTAAGAPAVQAPHPTGNNNRNALLRDPDGNLGELVAKIPCTRERDASSTVQFYKPSKLGYGARLKTAGIMRRGPPLTSKFGSAGTVRPCW